MTWSVFDGTDELGREDLFRYGRLQAPHMKAVVAGLEFANDADWYLQHALDNGFRPSPAEAIELIDMLCLQEPQQLLDHVHGHFKQEELLAAAELVSGEDLKRLTMQSLAAGEQFDDKAIYALCDYVADESFADALVSDRVVNRGPYKKWELNPGPYGDSVAYQVSATMLEGLLAGMDGRFTAEEMFAFAEGHMCSNYTDRTLEVLVSVSNCTMEEADDLFVGFGRERTYYQMPAASGGRRKKGGVLAAIGGMLLGEAAWGAMHQRGETSGEPHGRNGIAP